MINLFSISMYILAFSLLIFSFIKDKSKTKLALKKSWKSFENILPQFIFIIILIGLILVVLDKQVISNLMGDKSGIIGVFIAAIVGSITMIPPYISYPLAQVLLDHGAGISQITAFISTLMMVGVLTIPLEIKYWGKKATLLRNGFAFIFSIFVAIIMGVII